MNHTEAVTLCKDVSNCKWYLIAQGNSCGEDFSLLLFRNFLKYSFLQKAQTRSIISPEVCNKF